MATRNQRKEFGRGIGRVPSGAVVKTLGYDNNGIFWYEGRRSNGDLGGFLFRWQAVAFANGWNPPEDLTWKPLVIGGFSAGKV